MALLAQSNKASVNARCIGVRTKLAQDGHPVGLSTLRHWATPTPLSIGAHNSRANRTGNVADVEENIQAIKQYLNQKHGQASVRELSSAVDISKSSVHLILPSQNLYPFRCVEK